MNAVTVCVNYDDMLAITLPRMLEHFERVTVVTATGDSATVAIAGRYGADLHATNAFYRGGKVFNKGAALDEALSREHGWVCVLDADIVLPKVMPLMVQCGNLYSPFRRLLEEPGTIPPESEWSRLKLGPEYTNNEYAGYFHLFHMDDADGPPWYASNAWTTAQGCDSVFTWAWKRPKLRMPFEVLHLGEPVVNWEGRRSARWE